MDLFSGLTDKIAQVILLLEIIAIVGGVCAAVFALRLVITFFQPVFLVIGWLVGAMPGRPPSDLALGLSQGLRLLAWAAIVAGSLWVIVFHAPGWFTR